MERTHDFALGQARVAPQLEIRLEARQNEKKRERSPLAHPGGQAALAMEPLREPAEHARTVAALSVDEARGGRVDGGDAVERLEQPLVRRPEPDRVGHQLVQGDTGVVTLGGVLRGAKLRALTDGFAHGVDEAEPRAEMLVQRRACDTGAVGSAGRPASVRLPEEPGGAELAGPVIQPPGKLTRLAQTRPERLDSSELVGDVRERARGIGVQRPEPPLPGPNLPAQVANQGRRLVHQLSQISLGGVAAGKDFAETERER